MASLSVPAVAGIAPVKRSGFTSGGVKVPRRAAFSRVAGAPRVRAVVNAASEPEVRAKTPPPGLIRSRGAYDDDTGVDAVAMRQKLLHESTTFAPRVVKRGTTREKRLSEISCGYNFFFFGARAAAAGVRV